MGKISNKLTCWFCNTIIYDKNVSFMCNLCKYERCSKIKDNVFYQSILVSCTSSK